MAVGLFIMSQGIIENKMKEFNFFYFSRGYRALNLPLGRVHKYQPPKWPNVNICTFLK